MYKFVVLFDDGVKKVYEVLLHPDEGVADAWLKVVRLAKNDGNIKQIEQK